MKFRVLLAAIITIVAVLVYTSCKKGDEIIDNIQEIQVTPQNTMIVPGSTVQYKAIATMTDDSKEDISGKVTWRSNDESVATVDASGKATGVKKGFTFISASNGYNIGSTLLNIADETSLEKAQALLDYEQNYIGSENPDNGWTGDGNSCTAGDVSAETRVKVLQRVNYYRRLVGLSDNVTMHSSWNPKCMEAALMFHVNNTLNHYPPSSWTCWTQAGYDAAGNSNIAWGTASGPGGNHSVNAVTAYIRDDGANNIVVGHRRWILYSQLTEVGTGSTGNTNSLWVMQDNPSPSVPMPDFIAYPPAGYIPGPLVFERWHFGLTSGTFGSANVEMWDEGNNPVSLNIIDQSQINVGDNSIVWEPSGIITGSDDVKYKVTISGITGATPDTYTYEVIIIQPVKKKKSGYELMRESNQDFRLGDAPVMKN